MSLRGHYTAELEQLRLQVELMAVRVEQNLERMRAALEEGAPSLHAEAARVDREVDAMNVSLTERCYELIAREAPVASDLRLIVSVVRVLNELERISDHAVRICSDADGEALAPPGSRLYDLLITMGDEALERFHVALRASGSNDLDLAEGLATGSPLSDALHARLIRELLDIDGPDAVADALRVAAVARSLERISDHTSVVGARVRYLITGDPAHLAAESR
ncbi:MAG: phosphate signaling complex protein PhoU [Acidimicrobiia bacterium]|nr:phosphate signaling complex protein PhoU [Acidimicrobiia bacterium]